MISKICSTSSGASPSEGSSSSNTRGLAMSARAIAHICCSPPDKLPARWRARSRNRGNSEKQCSRSASMAARSRRRYAPISRFSSTVMSANSRLPSGTCTSPRATISCGCSAWIGSPNSVTSPPRAASSPEIVLSVVDLPAPLAPISVTISPARTSQSMPLSTSSAP